MQMHEIHGITSLRIHGRRAHSEMRRIIGGNCEMVKTSFFDSFKDILDVSNLINC